MPTTSQSINVGASANDGTGDTFRQAFQKVNGAAGTSAVMPGLGWYNATAYGATGDGSTDDRAALNTLSNFTMPAAPTAGGTLYLPPGTYRVASDMTFSDRTALTFAAGAMLSLDAGVTVTINGHINAGLYRIFTGAGATGSSATGIRFNLGRLTGIYPQWWGGEPDSLAHDDTLAVQAAVDAAQSTNIANYEPTTKVILETRGEWLITAEILISKPYTFLDGGGGWLNTSVRFETATGLAGTCFRFEGVHTGVTPTWIGNQPLYGCGIRGVTFVSGNSSYKKIAVDCVDCSSFLFDNIKTPGWNGAKSTILRFAGRDLPRIRDLSLYADRPIELTANQYAPTLAIDHFHISDVEIISQDAAEVGLTIGDNVGLANFTLDGRQAWGGGKGAIYYVPTASPTAQIIVNIHNMRYEGPLATTGYTIEWGSSAVATRHFNLYGCNLGGSGSPTNKGLKLRGCYHITVLSSIYTGADEPINIDSTCHDIHLFNWVALGGTPSITGQTLIYSVSTVGGLAMSPTSYYTNSADATSPYLNIPLPLIPHGSAPGNLNDGMLWTTTAGAFIRINGVTKTFTLT